MVVIDECWMMGLVVGIVVEVCVRFLVVIDDYERLMMGMEVERNDDVCVVGLAVAMIVGEVLVELL